MVRFTIPELQTEPVVVTQESLEKGMGRTLLLVVAHADDPAIFVGGVVAMWAKAGWHVHCLRVTDDRWDSVGLDEAETIRRNAVEFRQAARVLGIAGPRLADGRPRGCLAGRSAGTCHTRHTQYQTLRRCNL